MPTPTYTLIDSVTLTSSASSVTFSSISAAGKGDLVIITKYLGNGGESGTRYRFNSDSGANYSYVLAQGDGSTVSWGSSSSFTGVIGFATATATVAALQKLQISDYAATDKHKSVLVRSDRANQLTAMAAARWANTSAITNITIDSLGSNFAIGSTFQIYQIVSE
jgi:hypothetical protein